jgi:hypothetical protein
MDDLDNQKGYNVDHLVNAKQKEFVWIIELNEVFVYKFGGKVYQHFKSKLGPSKFLKAFVKMHLKCS